MGTTLSKFRKFDYNIPTKGLKHISIGIYCENTIAIEGEASDSLTYSRSKRIFA